MKNSIVHKMAAMDNVPECERLLWTAPYCCIRLYIFFLGIVTFDRKISSVRKHNCALGLRLELRLGLVLGLG